MQRFLARVDYRMVYNKIRASQIPLTFMHRLKYRSAAHYNTSENHKVFSPHPHYATHELATGPMLSQPSQLRTLMAHLVARCIISRALSAASCTITVPTKKPARELLKPCGHSTAR